MRPRALRQRIEGIGAAQAGMHHNRRRAAARYASTAGLPSAMARRSVRLLIIAAIAITYVNPAEDRSKKRP
jgi:hypothetical protein